MTVASMPHQPLYFVRRKVITTQIVPVSAEWVEQVLTDAGVGRLDLFTRLDRGDVIDTPHAWFAKTYNQLLNPYPEGGQ